MQKPQDFSSSSLQSKIDELNKNLGLSDLSMDVGSITPISGSEVFEAGLLNKISSDPVFNKIQKLLGVTKKTIEDPFTYLGGPIIGKAGKLTLAELSKEITKHNRIQSLLRSGAPEDIKEAKKIYKTIKIKDEGKARQLYTDMLNEGKKIVSPQQMEKATRDFRRRTEIKKYIESIPLKERLALYTDDTIPLTGKYKVLDEDVIDFYDDIIDIQKIPKNYKSGDNSLAKVFLDKKDIPARVDLDPSLNQLRPGPYYEEIFDFGKTKYKEKIKLYIPKEQVGGGVKYKTKTITNPSKNEIQKLLDEI